MAEGVEWVHWCKDNPLPIHVYTERCGDCGMEQTRKDETLTRFNEQDFKGWPETKEEHEVFWRKANPSYPKSSIPVNQFGVSMNDWRDYRDEERKAGRRTIPFEDWRNEGPQGEIAVDYHAAAIKHVEDYLKEHDPEVLDALFYTRKEE